MTEALLTVRRIGVRGDGIAEHAGSPVYLPFTAPGDVVRVALGVPPKIVAFETRAPRAPPRCPHFGACGGCSLQHLGDAEYRAAKMAWLGQAMRLQGLDAGTVRPLLLLPTGTRRRAKLAMKRPRDAKAPVVVGFRARASHSIVDLEYCAVLHPALAALVPPLRALAPVLLPPGEAGDATATLAESGIDLLLDLPAPPGLDALDAMAGFARRTNLARLAWRAADGRVTPVVTLRPVRMTFGGVAVDLPDDGFLQASAEADAALTALVLEAAAGAERIADLFAGVGTFTFALAALAPVHAVEGDAAAVAALVAAAARAQAKVTAERRDLDRRPLSASELARVDTVVFDPPRAGARRQSETLAASPVRRVAAVSCNPATFARDAHILADGGLRLIWVQPVDSFAWSAHLELVARFDRA